MIEPQTAAIRVLEATLLEPAFEPLAQAFGDYGEFAVQTFCETLARTNAR